MRLAVYPPPPTLARCVELIWMIEGNSQHSREKVLPNGAIELIVNLGSFQKVVEKTDFNNYRLYRDSWVAGIQEEFLVIEACCESNLVGVRFRPGGAYPFLSFPVAELTNQVVECDLLFGRLMVELRDRLLETDIPALRIAAIADVLLRRLELNRRDSAVEYALARMRQDPGETTVGTLAREIGVSNKHLIERFRKVVGMPPKLLSRVLRFQTVIRRANTQAFRHWTDIAHECGYYDQAHMIRDFRLFSGTTPSRYLLRRDDDENHIVIE